MSFTFILADPEEKLFEGEIHSLIVPGSAGYMEVLPHHAPLLSTLQPGTITITQKGAKTIYIIPSGSSGILEVQKNTALLLADAIEKK